MCTALKVIDRNSAFRNLCKRLRVQDEEFVKSLMDEVAAAEADACYYRSIVDGSWPDADEIIAHIRSKVKK